MAKAKNPEKPKEPRKQKPAHPPFNLRAAYIAWTSFDDCVLIVAIETGHEGSESVEGRAIRNILTLPVSDEEKEKMREALRVDTMTNFNSFLSWLDRPGVTDEMQRKLSGVTGEEESEEKRC